MFWDFREVGVTVSMGITVVVYGDTKYKSDIYQSYTIGKMIFMSTFLYQKVTPSSAVCST